MDHAYALLEVKTADAAKRTIRGIASTPELDRAGDLFDPAGATFKNPIPLLFHHDEKQPIGTATLAATADGITFEALLPIVEEAGPLKARIDDAWQCLKAGVISGASIGYRILDGGVEYLRTGGRRLRKTEICELSLVTIPANAQATIRLVKSLAAGRRMGSGMKQTVAEHITALENKRAALAARMTEIMESAAGEAKTLEDEAATEHDGLTLQVKSIDADLGRWREHEKLQIASAVAVPPAPAGRAAPLPVISVRANVPIGTAFVRAACAKLVCNGNVRDAADYAEKRWADSTPEVALYLKAAVAAGTATDATWAGPLVNQNIAADFIELLRPATILGKIPGLRQVPFNTKVPTQTAGGTYGWVGEAKPKPVTKLAFSSTSLGVSKAAGIIVLTKELVMLSNPSAEALVRADMVAGIAQFLDAQFIDPAVAAVAGVNPASITNGAPTAAGTVSPFADIMALINHFATNNIGVDGVTFILSAANCLALSFRQNTDGSQQFPGITVGGGSYKGLTFIASQAAGANVIALQPNLVLYADDGGVSIDASQEASLQMDSAPMSPSDATTVYVSLWQTNTVGLRAERFINWAKANANAVKYLTAVAWPAPSAMEANGSTARAKG